MDEHGALQFDTAVAAAKNMAASVMLLDEVYTKAIQRFWKGNHMWIATGIYFVSLSQQP